MVNRHKRTAAIKIAAAGIVNDVIEEAQRPGAGAVLVADVAINVTVIGAGD